MPKKKKEKASKRKHSPETTSTSSVNTLPSARKKKKDPSRHSSVEPPPPKKPRKQSSMSEVSSTTQPTLVSKDLDLEDGWNLVGKRPPKVPVIEKNINRHSAPLAVDSPRPSAGKHEQPRTPRSARALPKKANTSFQRTPKRI